MKSSLILVTPEIAAEMLSNNANNRPLRKGHVKRLADAILQGEWKVSPQPISIGGSGRLLDGQHRLTAIVEAGQAIQLMVCYGVEDSVFDVLDIGAKRSYSDISGLPRPVAVTITTLSKLFYGAIVSPQRMHEINKIYGDIAIDVHNNCKSNFRMVTSGGMKAAACFMIKKHGCHDYVFSQMRALASHDFRALSPINESLLRVVMRQTTKGKSSFNTVKCFNYGVKAFDHRLKNKKRISPDPNGMQKLRDFTNIYI